MAIQLTLDLPWLQAAPGQDMDGLVVRRGRGDVLIYEDGIPLQVRVLDPARHGSAEAVVEAAREQAGPRGARRWCRARRLAVAAP